MQPNALLIRQNFIVVKSGCYMEGATSLASAHGEAKALAQRIVVLEGELAEVRQA
jgi:hypothetical protein